MGAVIAVKPGGMVVETGSTAFNTAGGSETDAVVAVVKAVEDVAVAVEVVVQFQRYSY